MYRVGYTDQRDSGDNDTGATEACCLGALKLRLVSRFNWAGQQNRLCASSLIKQ